MLMQVKKTPSFRIIRDSKNLTEMVKATVWYILKKSECTGNLSNTKRPSWRTTLHHLTKSKTLSRRFCITVKAYNQETCSWMEIQEFTTRCKASFTFQNRKIRLDFAKKPLKGPALCWKKKITRPDENKMNLYGYGGKRKMWRRRERAHDPEHATLFIRSLCAKATKTFSRWRN